MALVCPDCGQYALGKIARTPNSLTCEECREVIPANLFPIFIVTGASGSGKTSILPLLRTRLPNFIIMDADLLWNRSAEGQYLNNWIKLAYANAQSGFYTLMCGTIMPWDLDACENRALVGPVLYLNLHCDDEDREHALRSRPAFRQSTDQFIAEHRKFAGWLVENADKKFDPPMPIINSSKLTKEAVANEVAAWVKSKVVIVAKGAEPSLAPGS